jgi:hypothetical protein
VLLLQSIGRSTLHDVDVKRRDEYTRCMSSMEGLMALGAAVARNSLQMLNEVSRAGRSAALRTLVLDDPKPPSAVAVENAMAASALIARVGDLERIALMQLALAEDRKARLELEALKKPGADAGTCPVLH